MNIVIAPDSYKGSLSAVEVGRTIRQAFEKELPDAKMDVIPMADGGEGTLETLVFATNGKRIQMNVTGPLGKKIESEYGVLGDGKTAIIEVAKIAGLPMVAPEKRNPLKMTTYGIGEAILEAAHAGYKNFIIGLGGSATNDGGIGMLQALGVTFLGKKGEVVPPVGSSLFLVEHVDFSTINPIVQDCKFRIASDVNNPLCGEKGASVVFGPQKGATAEQVKQLDHALENYAEVIEKELGKRFQKTPGAGAAGGLGYSFLLIGGEIMSGAEIVAEVTGLTEKIKNANLVITGEGQSDYQTLYGKVPSFIAKMAKKYEIPAILLSGGFGEGYEQLYDYFVSCFSTTAGPIRLEDCMENAEELLFYQSRNIARLLFAIK